jgi:hypothetical protein
VPIYRRRKKPVANGVINEAVVQSVWVYVVAVRQTPMYE